MDAIAELDPHYNLGRAVLTAELAPLFPRRHHQLEGHGRTGLTTVASPFAFGAVPDGRDYAFDRV
jgi:hypothetical protein